MTAQNHGAPTIIRRKEVSAKTGLPRSSLYDRVKAGTFPAPIRLGAGAKATGWIEAEVNTWIEEQINRSRATV